MDMSVPGLLIMGTPMLKVSEKKQKKVIFRIEPDEGQIIYESRKGGIVPIETIKELRTGANASYYRAQFKFPEEADSRWITIIYILEGTYKTLHMLADTRDTFHMWDVTLHKLYAIRQGLMTGLGNVEMRQTVWERQYWKGADDEGDQKLDFDDVERLCKRLNVNTSVADLQRLFREADTQKLGYLDFPAFQRFVKTLKRRPDIEAIYGKLSALNGGKLDYAGFERFMRDTQKSNASPEELKASFAKYTSSSPPATQASAPATQVSPPANQTSPPVAAAPASSAQTLTTPVTQAPPLAQASVSATHESVATAQSPAPVSQASTPAAQSISPVAASPNNPPNFMRLDGFSAFLMSPDNAAFSDHHGEIWQDMTRPMPEYYISSSHNTYLVGHQLVGVSTIEGYIRALLHSCRSVELDIYDGDHEPMIYHGKTLTSKVSLRDICQAIAKYAFVTSPYPLIISAEVHCGIDQQDMMVNIMMEVFGEALVRAPVEGRPKIEVLPSPEDLKGKFLLKAKNLYVVDRLATLQAEKAKAKIAEADPTSTSSSNPDAGMMDGIKTKWRKARGKDPNKPEKPKVRMSFALTSLLVYTVGVKCHGISSQQEYAPEHIFSLSENSANKLLKASMNDLVKHNQTHVTRIYPKGTRVNSTNYEPHRYWAAGAQVVAINWQTFDLGYMINQAMFQCNGRSGFVLKPEALRDPAQKLLAKHTKHYFDVSVISAQQLPRPRDSNGQEIIEKSIVDPFVEVSLHIPDWTHSPFLPPQSKMAGVKYSPPSDATTTSATSASTISFRTSIVKNNGFNPVWQETLNIPFDCVGDMKELIFVEFAVRQKGKDDDDDEPLASYCTPLASLQHGFRHLPLHDSQLAQHLFSTLFVHISVRNV